MQHVKDAPERWSKLERESSFFSCTNRNKRSLTVDLKTPEGLSIAKKLAAKADVLMENVRAAASLKRGFATEQYVRLAAYYR
jgi:succinate--hydroxymethylglutarate CoA-transferase